MRHVKHHVMQVLALFRLTPYSGRIVIDGHELQAIGLERVRKCITIIPQDPVLHTGTVTHALDPSATCTPYAQHVHSMYTPRTRWHTTSTPSKAHPGPSYLQRCSAQGCRPRCSSRPTSATVLPRN